MKKVLLFALLFAPLAQADEIYAYQGTTIAGCACSISGWFEVPSALPPGAQPADRLPVSPTDFSFTGGGQKFMPSNTNASYFGIGIGPDGNVFTWFVDLLKPNGNQLFTQFYGSVFESDDSFIKGNKVFHEQGSPGTWTHDDLPSALAVVETPEPGILGLLLSSLVLLKLVVSKIS